MKLLQLNFAETQTLMRDEDYAFNNSSGWESYLGLTFIIGICLFCDWLYYQFFSCYGTENFWMNFVSDVGQGGVLLAGIMLVIDAVRRQYKLQYLKEVYYHIVTLFMIYFICLSLLLGVGRLLACTTPAVFLAVTAVTILGLLVVTLARIQTLMLAVTGQITTFGRLIVASSRAFIVTSIAIVIPAVGVGFLASGRRKSGARHVVQNSDFHIDNSVIFIGGFFLVAAFVLLLAWWSLSRSVRCVILSYYVKRHPERYRKVLGLSPEVFYSYYWERTVKDPVILASIRAEQAKHEQ